MPVGLVLAEYRPQLAMVHAHDLHLLQKVGACSASGLVQALQILLVQLVAGIVVGSGRRDAAMAVRVDRQQIPCRIPAVGRDDAQAARTGLRQFGMQHTTILVNTAALVPAYRRGGGRAKRVLLDSRLQARERLTQPLVNLGERFIGFRRPFHGTQRWRFDGGATIRVGRTGRDKPRVGVRAREHQRSHVPRRLHPKHPQRLVRVLHAQLPHLLYKRDLQQGRTCGHAERHPVIPPVRRRKHVPHGPGLLHVSGHHAFPRLVKSRG